MTEQLSAMVGRGLMPVELWRPVWHYKAVDDTTRVCTPPLPFPFIHSEPWSYLRARVTSNHLACMHISTHPYTAEL
jgi:hypothetical protein